MPSITDIRHTSGAACTHFRTGTPILTAKSSLRPARRGLLKPRAQKVEEAKQASQASQNGAQSGIQNGAQNGAQCSTEDSFYPTFEEDGSDEGLFPVRQPGAFPQIKVTTGWKGALNKMLELTQSPAESSAAAEPSEYDPLRDGPLRYLGYANECGEAFAAWLPFYGVPLSYAVAIGYVLVDTGDKGVRAWKTANVELEANVGLHPEVNVPALARLLAFERALDTVIWQLLASVACPGYTIHTVVALVHAVLKPIEATSQVQQLAETAGAAVSLPAADVMAVLDKSLPTALGLAAIPFIVHPIDNTIHALMNVTLRPAMRLYVCGSGQGSLADLQMCSEECVPSEATSSSGPSGKSNL